MIISCIDRTTCHSIIKEDVANNRLSHAYLIVCNDKAMLRFYLKELAKLVLNGDERTNLLIDKETHPDVSVYPEQNKKINTENIDNLIQNTLIKPIEGDKRLFLLAIDSVMSDITQNKLLKTLEEPPNGVFILIGTTSPSNLLSTIKSRVRRLDIPPFSINDLQEVYAKEFSNSLKFNLALSLCEGLEGNLIKFYNEDEHENLSVKLIKSLHMLKNYDNVLLSIHEFKDEKMANLYSLTKLVMHDILAIKSGGKNVVMTNQTEQLYQIAREFNVGSVLSVIEFITSKQKSMNFNMNNTMLLDGLFLHIYKEQLKWQKL